MGRNSATAQGRSHRSRTVRFVGWEGHEKRWAVVCGAPRHEGQMSSGLRRTLSRYELRAGQNPERSWDRVVRNGRGRESSSSAIGGAGSWRTRFGGREAMEEETAAV